MLEQLKQQAIDFLDAHRAEFEAVSLDIHAHPELAFREFRSAEKLCALLGAHGFAVERGVGGLETAFWAEAGSGDGPTVAILAEYDALPEIGHACGHNIIGTSAAAAGIAVRQLMGRLPGRIVVIGTPAEEGGGGKVIMAKAGVFDGVDAAMMTHPASRTMTTRGSMASNRLTLEFFGRASHAASAPDEGINALDAAVQAYVNISTLRQQMRYDARVHGVISKGGTAPNVIPDHTELRYSVRANTKEYADELLARVIKCAEAAALATGCTLKHASTPGYANIVPNPVMAELHAQHLRALGLEVEEPRAVERMGSTDMGDVSHIVPSIHPYIRMVPASVAGHTIAFRDASASPAGMLAQSQAAKSMAMTAIELLGNAETLAAVKAAFNPRAA